MKPVTFFVRVDEKAMSLREINLVRPPTHQWHRYQIITVVRNDGLAEFWQDLGPKDDYTAPEIEIPSLLEHTVAELRDIAENYRQGGGYWERRMAEIQAESTLIPDWINQVEERRKIIHNQSVFGPGVSKQRIGFPRKEVLNGNRA